jgi:hypothetical protein
MVWSAKDLVGMKRPILPKIDKPLNEVSYSFSMPLADIRSLRLEDLRVWLELFYPRLIGGKSKRDILKWLDHRKSHHAIIRCPYRVYISSTSVYSAIESRDVRYCLLQGDEATGGTDNKNFLSLVIQLTRLRGILRKLQPTRINVSELRTSSPLNIFKHF